ncbi:undecaprenyl diphosphate synthase family protein [Aspergillus novofumigatus IBT 16806]|uniref:Alkyl transferase n=1 Tax=Aspergillus novofumigatus (strain IBT 16806) TaxID=1392255 RepID=A0A2I1CKC6_ASPN1|nr:Undecaprenyl diphosphate synthase [Aspergillus novofumigatus IBT 16806]PKX98080.1 Undecaprenyl diphosphate synthase [Aspergillus novofumigatus IBT 16806]
MKKALKSKWARDLLMNIARQGPIPQHVAFIMDGNRRFARARGMPIEQGHELGAATMKEIVETGFIIGIKVITVYTFSIENFKRPRDQIEAIMALFREQIAMYSAPGGFAEQLDFSIRVLGRLEMLDEKTRDAFEKAVEATRKGKLILNLCVAYTSRDEMTRAMRRCVEEYPHTAITAQSLSDNLDTAHNPPVDLVVRSSGVYRLSDFLLWQCHEDTQIQIVDATWPEFGAWEPFMVLLRWQRMKISSRRRSSDLATARSQVMASSSISSSAVACALPLLFSFLSALSCYYFLATV